jgi:hypothetical protein
VTSTQVGTPSSYLGQEAEKERRPTPLPSTTARLAWYVLVAAVLSAMLSRTLVAYAAAPPVVNFAHFPLVGLAYVLARRRSRLRAVRNAERLLVVSAILTAASWMGGTDSSLLRAMLLWPVLMEPFVVILTIYHLSGQGMPSRWARYLAVSIVLAEVPIALGQALTSGIGDAVQGTLVGQGAGHHVLGLMGLAVALTGLADLVMGQGRLWSWSGAMVAGGFSLGILTDVKQGLALFLVVAALVGVIGLRRRSHLSSRALATLAAVATLVILAASLNTFSLALREPWRASAFLDAKTAAFTTSTELMAEAPVGYLVGLGPGTTYTRVAWLTSPLGADSFLQRLDLETTAVAARLAEEWRRNPLWQASSATSPFSTWTGVFGDLGALGLLAYAGLWWLLARVAIRFGADGPGALGLVVFSILLGILFNWLEEPQYVLTVGLLIGAATALDRSLEEDRGAPVLSPPGPS